VDIGCGTGVSTLILADIVGPGGRVTGVDISQGMLAQAVKRCSGRGNVDLIEGDAEMLDGILGERTFDAVLYNACIFLLPDAGASLKGAYRILRPGGTVAMNFIAGAYFDERELFTELFPEWTGGSTFPAPRFPADIPGLEGLATAAGLSSIRSGAVDRPMTLENIQRFYQVPAQSSSLYPKLAVRERMAAVERMFELARPRCFGGAVMRWRWITGKK